MSNQNNEAPRNMINNFAITSEDVIFSLFEDGEVNIKSQEDYGKVMKAMQCTRDRGVNVTNLCENGKNTIEFRIPNGSINPQVVRENIKFFGSLLQVSKEMSLNPMFKNREFKILKQKNLTEKEKVESLLNLLFDDESEKSIYRERWDSIKDHSAFEMLKASNPTFKRKDYSMKTQTVKMFAETKAKDRADFFQILKNEFVVFNDYVGR